MSAPERPPAIAYATATLADLIREPTESRCDACGEPVDGSPDEGFSVPGQGVYMWSRGEERRFETVPLCASCSAAIGLTALMRWEIEEEEG